MIAVIGAAEIKIGDSVVFKAWDCWLYGCAIAKANGAGMEIWSG
ncbi:MAG: hypothetical protein CM1200mP30_17850 [Pseudomonadota bacterium]|nr:MAG: hypothetical protein CM1200mP30_17850 [Pseudomonadota bacterium]